MPVVDGRDQRRGIGFSEQDNLLVRMKIKHDYPACALFRGGKCTCDEADNLCPKCGSEEWDRITDRTSPGAAFNRCNRCENEWEPVDNAPMPQSNKQKQEAFRARQAMLGHTEVRGIYAAPTLHAAIKEAARKLMEKHKPEEKK